MSGNIRPMLAPAERYNSGSPCRNFTQQLHRMIKVCPVQNERKSTVHIRFT